MSATKPGPRLEAMLRDLPPPPLASSDLAGRVLAAAAATPQEAQPARARRAVARRDRRGRWLRRPLLAGTAALGLIVTSAVAATLAGVPIPQKIAAVFFPEKALAPKQATPAPPVRRAPAPVAPVRTAEAVPSGEAAWLDQPGPIRRLMVVERRVAARRAMGLPTPRADRLERQLRRRAELWRNATPEQRTEWQARQRDRRAAWQAALASPEGQAMQAQLRRWRVQRDAGMPLTPEQRAERRDLVRAWRMQRGARRPPLTGEQREARQARVRQWRETRRARWQARNAPVGAATDPRAETPASDHQETGSRPRRAVVS